MIRLIDTNAVSYLIENSLSLTQVYYLAPEVESEAELTQIVLDEALKSNYISIYKYHYFKEHRYFHHFKEMLNKHSGISFFNMTGLGDISILATVHTLLEAYAFDKDTSLFPPCEEIQIYTDDLRLRAKIPLEFKGHAVNLFNYPDLK